MLALRSTTVRPSLVRQLDSQGHLCKQMQMQRARSLYGAEARKVRLLRLLLHISKPDPILACDNCRKAKCKCEPGERTGEGCRNCELLGLGECVLRFRHAGVLLKLPTTTSLYFPRYVIYDFPCLCKHPLNRTACSFLGPSRKRYERFDIRYGTFGH